MFSNGTSLRHLPFFEEVAAHEEHQAEWRAATAGLVTLRLVDAWIEEGPEVVAHDSFMANAVLKAIDKMDDGSTLPGILRSVVSAMQTALPGDTHGVLPRLIAYGRALEYAAQWMLAIDVYDTVVTHAHPVEESNTATLGQQRRGFCLRTLGFFDEARESYAKAETIATQAGDMVGVLYAKIGEANVIAALGNLPAADQAFGSIASEARRLGFGEPQSQALDSRAAVAGFRGDHELAIRYAYDALSTSENVTERDRILSNIGTAFHMLGLRSAAKDAFVVLAATAQEQYTRWAAMLTLMTLAAEEGSEQEFDQIRRRITTTSMPPDVKVDYFLHVGRSQRELHHEDLAQIAFSKAIQLAEHHLLARHLFEAERELEMTPASHRSRVLDGPTGIPDSVNPIAAAIRDLRVQALQATP